MEDEDIYESLTDAREEFQKPDKYHLRALTDRHFLALET